MVNLFIHLLCSNLLIFNIYFIKVEIWHIGMASSITMGPVYSNFNLNKSTDKQFLNQIKNSVIKISLIESEIVSTSFSPDGTIISVALNNGSVYFYKVCDFLNY